MITSEPAGVLKIRIPLLSIETMCISLYTVYKLLFHKCLCFCKYKQKMFSKEAYSSKHAKQLFWRVKLFSSTNDKKFMAGS